MATVPTMEQKTLMVKEGHDTLRADCVVIRIIRIFSKTKNVTADTAEEKRNVDISSPHSILLAFST